MTNLSQAELLKINEQIEELIDKSIAGDTTAEREIGTLLKNNGISSYRELQTLISDKGDEQLLVLNEDGSSTGRLEYRKVVHAKNLWHQEVGCLPLRCLTDKNGRKKLLLLLEKRSPSKPQHPGAWALVAGHVVGFASLLESACSEAGEELRSLYYKEDFLQITPPTKNVRENENYAYATAFVVSDRLVKDQFLYQPEEVSGLAWYTIDEFENMVERQNPTESIFKNNDYYKRIIYALRQIEKTALWDECLGTHKFDSLRRAIGSVESKNESEPNLGSFNSNYEF